MSNEQLLVNKKPWFNQNCKDAKRNIRKSFKICKRSNFEDEQMKEFVNSKKIYRRVLNQEKKKYETEVLEKLSNLKNTSEFWKTVKLVTPKKQKLNNNIPYEKYMQMFIEFQNKSPINYDAKLISPNSNTGGLDKDFTLNELKYVISKIRKGKSPGPDGLQGEMFKILNPEWEHYLLNLFNSVLLNETTPEDWSVVKFTLLFKNGDADDPSNYRGISLINNITKIFTALISERLYEYVEINYLLPEEQAGFRRNRSCTDNVFILHSAINIQLGKHGGKLFGIFVDFRKAFDSITQSKLWCKLYHLGLSAKLIRVIKHLYDQAYVLFNLDNGSQEKLKIRRGVLQGDSLSPLLFILFISDIIDFFEKKGMHGINIGWIKNLLLLLYADDLVLFALTWKDAQDMLKVLSEYCDENDLEVNITKTKIVIFRIGNNSKIPKALYFKKEKVEIVKKYKYLGVQFNSSGLYLSTADNFISRATLAAAKVHEILRNSKSDCFTTKCQLYDTIVNPTLLYCSEIWAPRYIDKLEVVQTRYFKRIFCWPRCTPNHYVRLETGRCKIRSSIIKAIIKWWIKIINMKEDRLPKACFNKCVSLDKNKSNKAKFNWYSQLKTILEEFGGEYLLELESSDEISKALATLVEQLNIRSISEDVEAVLNSGYNSFYRRISSLGVGEEYMRMRLPMRKIKIISQIRVAKQNRCRIIHNGCFYLLDGTEKCSICNMNEDETVDHFFFKCPHYSHLRQYWLRNGNQTLENLLSTNLLNYINSIYHYTVEALRIRAFLRNE